MWMQEYRVDGLRMDMTLYIRSVAGQGNDDLPDGWRSEEHTSELQSPC